VKMKNFVIFFIGIGVGIFGSYVSLEWFVERDREVIEISSDIGLAKFFLEKLEARNANVTALNCDLMDFVKRTSTSAKRATERLDKVRFYEPAGTISVNYSSIQELEQTTNSEWFSNMELKCKQLKNT
jgi:hypothetical protein